MTAKELQLNHKFVEEMNGTEIEVVTNPQIEDERVLFIGATPVGARREFDLGVEQELVMA